MISNPRPFQSAETIRGSAPSRPNARMAVSEFSKGAPMSDTPEIDAEAIRAEFEANMRQGDRLI